MSASAHSALINLGHIPLGSTKLYVFSRRREWKDRQVDGQEILAAIVSAGNGRRTIHIQQLDGHPTCGDIAIGGDCLRGVGEADDCLKRLTWPVEDTVTQVDRHIVSYSKHPLTQPVALACWPRRMRPCWGFIRSTAILTISSISLASPGSGYSRFNSGFIQGTATVDVASMAQNFAQLFLVTSHFSPSLFWNVLLVQRLAMIQTACTMPGM